MQILPVSGALPGYYGYTTSSCPIRVADAFVVGHLCYPSRGCRDALRPLGAAIALA